MIKYDCHSQLLVPFPYVLFMFEKTMGIGI